MTVARIARQLNRTHRQAGGRWTAPLVLLTDRRRLADPEAAARRLPAGSAVILRDYDAPDRLALALRLRRLTRERRLLLLVAADWRLAARIGADGVHLPEGMAGGGRLAPLLGRQRRTGRLLTAAAHSRAALARAAELTADAVLLSPVFPTASHPEATVLGSMGFRRLARRAELSVVALGGITAANALRLSGSAAAAIAGISGLAG
jgi:thiamine-phosphate pyrophosphorylase